MIPALSTAVTNWLSLIRAEYREMSGLNLTRSQAERFWGLEPHTCELLLDSLVGTGFLRRTSTGAFVLGESVR